MKVIITSGGTREHIDNVRTLSNVSSGRLGQLCAEAFLREGYEVIYIHGVHAYLPSGNVENVRVEGVLDLEREMKRALNDKDVVAVVHAMAVSDYFVSAVSNFETVAKQTEHKSKEAILEIFDGFDAHGFDRSHKIRSDEAGLAVLLKPAPKIIHLVKEQRNDVVLVGFKLLVDVTVSTLIDVGYALLKKNHCNFVLANDLTLIENDHHVGHLISVDGSYQTYTTKQEIATGIVASVHKGVKGL